MKLFPLLVQVFPIFLVLLDGVELLLLRVHLECLIEGQWIDFLQDGLQGYQRLLQNLMPMVLGKVHDDWHQHWEGLLLVGLKDVQEVVVLEEAHGSVGHLQLLAANTLDEKLE